MANENMQSIIIEILTKITGRSDIDANSRLFEELGMNSLQFVNFLVELENQLDLQFPDEWMDRSRFDKVSSIEAMCLQLAA